MVCCCPNLSLFSKHEVLLKKKWYFLRKSHTYPGITGYASLENRLIICGVSCWHYTIWLGEKSLSKDSGLFFVVVHLKYFHNSGWCAHPKLKVIVVSWCQVKGQLYWDNSFKMMLIKCETHDLTLYNNRIHLIICSFLLVMFCFIEVY